MYVVVELKTPTKEAFKKIYTKIVHDFVVFKGMDIDKVYMPLIPDIEKCEIYQEAAKNVEFVQAPKTINELSDIIQECEDKNELSVIAVFPPLYQEFKSMTESVQKPIEQDTNKTTTEIKQEKTKNNKNTPNKNQQHTKTLKENVISLLDVLESSQSDNVFNAIVNILKEIKG